MAQTQRRRGRAARAGKPYVTTNRTREGERVYEYVVLRYEEVDEEGRRHSRPLLNLGRSEAVDRGKAETLADLMREFVRPGSTMTADELRAHLSTAKPQLKILCSRQFGLRLLVEQAFVELGYKEVLAEIDQETRCQFSIERAVFGLVLQQVVWPGSKLRAADRLGDVVFFPEGADLSVHHYYRALDVVGEHKERLAAKLRDVLQRVEGLIFDEIGLDTTSSYFETDYDDEEWKEIAHSPDPGRKVAPVVNEPPLRMRGHSKDKRPNKPQIIVEQVVNAGYVIHHETLPGNTADQSRLPETVEKLSELGVGQDAVWIADTGMNTARGREALARREIDWVMGEGRARTKIVAELLSSGGRLTRDPDDPDLSYRAHHRDGRLFVVRLNRKERKRELRSVDRHVAKVRAILAKDDRADDHGPNVCRLLTHRTYKQYVTRRADDPSRLTLDPRAVKRAKNRAGKSVISTSLTGLEPSVADKLYRLQFKVEDTFRTLKSGLELRPIRHRRADRIKAHVLISIMAYNVVRHLERKTGMKLAKLRDVLASACAQRVALGAASYWQSTDLDAAQRTVFERMGYDLPLVRFETEVVSG